MNVGLEGTTLGAATDVDGRFTISDVPVGTYTVQASLVGYLTAERTIRVRTSETTQLEVELSQQAVELSGSTVTGRRGGYVAESVTSANKIGAPLTETPQSVSVITRDQLAVKGVDRLSEALRYTPGVQGETFGFEPRTTFLRFRGFDATTTGLYRNGLQLRNPSFAVGYSPEPYGAERIEVPRGPASVLYGAGSPGGLVNFVSKKPTRQPFREVIFEPGTYNRWQGKLDALAVDNQAQVGVTTGPVRQTVLFGIDYQQVGVASTQNFGTAPAIDIFDPNYGADVPEPSPFADTDTDQRQIGLYLQDHVDVFDHWTLTLNGRFDWARTKAVDDVAESTTEQDDQAFSGRAGIVYESDFGLAPYASYSESFLPSLGTDAEGEPFDPERGQQWEVGAKYQPTSANSFVTVALFDLTRQNFLQTDPETFRQVQTGEANSRGVEVEGVAEFDFGLDLTASYTRQDIEITESVAEAEEGERPTQVREQMGSLWVDYTLQGGVLDGFGVGAGVRYLRPSYGDVPNTLKAPATAVLFLADRWVPSGVVDPTWWANGAFFGCWLLTVLYALVRPNIARTHRSLLVIGGLLALLIPVANGLTTGGWPWIAWSAGHWEVLGVDVGAVLCGITALGIAACLDVKAAPQSLGSTPPRDSRRRRNVSLPNEATLDTT